MRADCRPLKGDWGWCCSAIFDSVLGNNDILFFILDLSTNLNFLDDKCFTEPDAQGWKINYVKWTFSDVLVIYVSFSGNLSSPT